MRAIEKDMENEIARSQLESDGYFADVELSVAKQKGSYSSSRYGHRIVREELSKIYFNKCAFCESKIKPVATPNVEHFRPKSRITGVNDSGYYWLGYEWSNLLLACPSCNGAKGTKFPLNLANHVQTHPVKVDGELDCSKFPDSEGHCKRERPLLINPEFWKPEKLMSFDYQCQLYPIKDNRMARTTIIEIDLNREDLVAERQAVVNNIVNRIREQIAAKYMPNGLNEGQFQHQLNLIFKEIVGRINPAAEYTLLGKNIIENFDGMILKDLEPEFHEQIKQYFVLFLEETLVE